MAEPSPLVETPDLRLLLTTVATEAEAQQLAQAAVEAGLAACVSITPIQSCYRWQGAIALDTEQQLSFKTTADRLESLQQWLQAQHPYDLPECLVLTPIASSAAYGDWLRSSLS
ncbi:divalent-cation tolerance protein CutA [Synechococcus elongatus]|uniref:Divalent-cation tolerance protein CutA n=1 Tax=Synechococcus elongatus PCC 11801 TaxID=2219813 RepID=A0AAN1UU06_SYNEL|nr:divalent-cation tolerance protein CutA [Synechococcus elongatus]AZB72099.1 divalent-cation tolerance protein CutA [Synechococcus elongatus PCC 11801]